MLSDIAQTLVDGCRAGQEVANLDRLYAPDAVSVEPRDQGNGRETRGLDGIRAKHDWWSANMEVTAQTISGPFPHGEDRFAVVFEVSGRDKSSDEAFDFKEVAVYHVADGKIVREEFFY